jgi:hypothetical protein
MKLPTRLLVTALSLVTLAASCGGKVVVDPLTETVEEACARWCEVLTACASPLQENCLAACVTRVGYYGKCAPSAVVALACMASGPADLVCTQGGCEEEQAQALDCTHPPGGCSTNECESIGSGMHCTTTCGGNVYEVLSTGSPGSWACTCIRNGSTVGTCTDVTVAWGDCCLGIFAGP